MPEHSPHFPGPSRCGGQSMPHTLLDKKGHLMWCTVDMQLNFWHFGGETLQAYSDVHFYQASTKTFPIISPCPFQAFETSVSTGEQFWLAPWPSG
ncbi:hypothetical protein ACOMHN_044997 [Nucella lapillus]